MSVQSTDGVVIGIDPHKRSVTIEVMAPDDHPGQWQVCHRRRRLPSDARVRRLVKQRVRAIEGCAGSGGHAAARLTRTGEDVVDVPSKLSARARVFTSGQGRKTDATDAHSVVLVGVRMTGPRAFVNDEQLGLLRVLVDRRRSLGEDHTRMVSQVHALLL